MSEQPRCRLIRIDLSKKTTDVELLPAADHRRYNGMGSRRKAHTG